MERSEEAAGRRSLGGYPNRRVQIVGIVFTGVWLLYLLSAVSDLLRGHYSDPYIAGGFAILVAFVVI